MVCSLVILTGTAFPQTFEVASVRLSGPKSIRGSDGGPGRKDPTRYTFGRANLVDFLLVAYGVELFQVSSKLPLDRHEFDLAANVPALATQQEFQMMMRNLLAERFHLRLHIESTEFPAFEMVLAKGGTKVGTEAATTVASGHDFPQLPPGRPDLTARNATVRGRMLTRILGRQQPLSRLAEFLRTAEPRPVVDKTGLTGTYDFALEFSTELANETAAGFSESAPAPDLNTALREQLGLQLVPKKLPFDVVVVEGFDPLPTEN